MLTAIVIARNESKNIGRCLESLTFCDHILVVDDNSTDDTPKIAKKYKAEVLTHSLDNNFAMLRNFALSEAKTPWVLFVDADEVVSLELAAEIKTSIIKIEFKGFAMRRLDTMWSQTLQHGDVGNVWLVRLARRGAGKWDGSVHESWQVEGKIGRLKQPLMHYPHPDLVSFLQHIDHYSSIKADYFFKQGRKTNVFEIMGGPIWRFFKAYCVQLGLLDGVSGFVHAMAMAMYSFLVTSKLYLLYKGIGNEGK